MKLILYRSLLLNLAWGSCVLAHYDGFSLSVPLGKWTTTPISAKTLWAECSTVDVTLTETQTIIQSGPAITVTDTSISKSGTVLNTTVTATRSAPARRHFSSYGSDWEMPTTTATITASEIWTHYAHCSPSTFTATVTEYTTSILPPSTVTKTSVEVQPESTLSCSEGCKVDVTATKLVYPKSVIHVTVPITVDSLPEPHTPEALTWEYSGVVLTYPTTYLFYTEFSHAFLAATETKLATTCPTASDTLTLPAPTNYAALIYPQHETPGPDLPPTALISYLNGQQTVLVQLSGTPIGSSCDPVGGGIVEPVAASTGPAQIIYTSTYILAQTTSTTETLVAIASGNSTSTSTSSPTGVTAAATFASTGTSTVIITSSSASVQVVSVAAAPLRQSSIGAEGFALSILGVLLAWL